MEEPPRLNLRWRDWALIGTGAILGLTIVGYVHDNYWDPSAKRKSSRKSRRSKRPPSEKTKLERDNPTLAGENLFKKLIQTGEHLEQLKKFEEAEKYFLRLYDLAKDEAARSPPDVGPVLITFVLHYLVKNYRNQKKWELAEDSIEEMLSLREALQDPTEWELSLVDTLIHQKRYKEALERGLETKTNIQNASQVPGNDGRLGLNQFMLHEKLAEIYTALGDLDKAAIEMKDALNIKSPQTGNRAVRLELDLTTLYLVQGKKEKAEEVIQNWSQRPEIKNKSQFARQRFIASCYYDANLLETAEKLFSDIKSETQGESSHKSEYEQAVNALATIAHERLQPNRALEHYQDLRKQTDLYAYTISRYFLTVESKFIDKEKVGENAKGVWKLELESRKILAKGVPTLKAGMHLAITTETVENEEKEKSDLDDKAEQKEEEEEEDSSLKTKKVGVTLTPEMLAKGTFEVETPEILCPSNTKMVIEIEIFSDSSEKMSLGMHHQFVCLMKKEQAFSLSPELIKQLSLMQG